MHKFCPAIRLHRDTTSLSQISHVLHGNFGSEIAVGDILLAYSTDGYNTWAQVQLDPSRNSRMFLSTENTSIHWPTQEDHKIQSQDIINDHSKRTKDIPTRTFNNIYNMTTETSTASISKDEQLSNTVDVELGIDKVISNTDGATHSDSKNAEETTEKAEELTEEELAAKRQNFYKKAIVGTIFVLFVGFVIADSLTNGYIGAGISSFLEWIEANPTAGFFVFMVVYFIATVFFVPGSILTLGAGFVFANAFGLGPGVLLGSVSVFLGAGSGAIASFLLGRFLLREWVSGFSKKYAIFEALDVAFEEKGFRIMALLRLSPIIPFNAINYIAGVTALSFWSYVWALIAILPGTVLYVFLGASAGSLADSASSGENPTVTIVVVVVGVIFGVIAVGLTSYYAKMELNKVAEKRQGEVEGDETIEN